MTKHNDLVPQENIVITNGQFISCMKKAQEKGRQSALIKIKDGDWRMCGIYISDPRRSMIEALVSTEIGGVSAYGLVNNLSMLNLTLADCSADNAEETLKQIKIINQRMIEHTQKYGVSHQQYIDCYGKLLQQAKDGALEVLAEELENTIKELLKFPIE